MRRLGLIAFSLLALARASAAQPAADKSALAGRWQTPGGNSARIEIKETGLEGRLIRVAAEQGPFGFNKGDVILKDFSSAGTTVTFQVAVRIDDVAAKSCPPAFQTFTGTLSGDRMEGTLRKSHFEKCKLVFDEGTDAVSYVREPPVGCLELPDNKPVFTVSREGPEAVTVVASVSDPLPDAAPAVRVQTVAPLVPGSKSAVAGAEVEWKLRIGDKDYATFYTDTDDSGIARLQFGLQPDGSFAPAFQTRQKPGTIPAGVFSVIASLPALDTGDYTLGPGLEKPPPAAPVTFALTLKRSGALLNFIDETASTVISTLLWPQPLPGRSPFAAPVFRLELAEFDATDDPEMRTVGLTSYQENGDVLESRDFKLQKQAAGIYRYVDTVITAKFPAGPHPLAAEIYVPKAPVSRIVATYVSAGGTKVTNNLMVYSSPRAIRRRIIEEALDKAQQTLDGIRASAHDDIGDAERAALAYKQSLIDRARAALSNRDLGQETSAPMLVAEAYLSQLSVRGPWPKAKDPKYVWRYRGPATGELSTMATLEVRTDKERAALKSAESKYWTKQENEFDESFRASSHLVGLDIELPKDPAERAAAIRKMLSSAALTVGKGVASFVFSAELGLVYGVWVLCMGLTLEGEPAGVWDYLLAGLDVTSFHLHTGAREKILRAMSAKLKELEEIRGVAGAMAKAAGRVETTLEDFRNARQAVRLRNELMSQVWKTAKNAELATGEKMREIARLMTRVPNPEVARLLQAELSNVPPIMNRQLGLMFHKQKELETKAFLRFLAKAGKVTEVEEGRFAWTAVVNGEEARFEEFVEYSKGGKRIDGALVKKSKAESFIKIRDLTTRLRDDHWERGKLYMKIMQTKVEGIEDLPASYCEYYWTESQVTPGNTAFKTQLDQY